MELIIFIILFVIIILLFLLSASFSGIETAYTSLNPIRYESVYRNKHSGRYAKKLLSNKKKFLITVLIGNNIVNILLTILTTVVFLELFGSAGPAIATGLLTFMILTFGEILPKTFANSNNELIIKYSATPFYYLQLLLSPISSFFESITQVLFYKKSKEIREFFGDEELESILEMGVKQNQFRTDEKDIILNLLKIDDIPTKEIMIPLSKIVSIEENSIIGDFIETFEGNYSRVLIYSKTKDNLTGFIHAKDVLVHHKSHSNKRVSELKRKVIVVSEHRVVRDVLKEMLKKNTHLAVVKNKKGKSTGIITQEDIFEEFLGEIYDETDDLPTDKNEVSPISRSKETHYLVNGTFKIESINKLFKVKLPHKNGETASQFIKNRIKTELEEGAKLRLKNVALEIHSLSKNDAIRKVRIIKY